jgi:hypothetical protein
LIEQKRLDRIIRTLIKLENMVGYPLRKEIRETIVMCPIISFSPDQDKEGRQYRFFSMGSPVYSKIYPSVYTNRESSWWRKLDIHTRKEYITEVSKWINTRYTGKLYKYVSLVDGKLISTYSLDSDHHRVHGAKPIRYTPNLITCAPKNSIGIFLMNKVYKSDDDCFKYSSANRNFPLYIYEVRTLDRVNRLTRVNPKTGKFLECGEGYPVCMRVQLTKLVRVIPPLE